MVASGGGGGVYGGTGGLSGLTTTNGGGGNSNSGAGTYGGAGDNRSVVAVIAGDVEPTLDHGHGDLTVRQGRFDRSGVDLLGLLYADRDLDLHLLRVEAEGAQEGQRRMMQRVLHRADRRLGVVAAVQIVAAAHFEDDALGHHRAFQTSSRTMAAATCGA